MLKQEISRVNTVQQGLQGEIRTVKNQTTEMADVIAGKNFQIQTREQERITLLGQIVQSPDRIKREIVEMGTTVEQEKENVAFLGQKIRELTEREEALVQAKADLTKSSKLLDETTDQLKKQHRASEEVEAMKEQIVVQQQQLKELAAGEQQLRRQEQMLQERVARLGRQQEQRRGAAAQSLGNVRKEREQIEQERLASRGKAEDNEARAEALQDEIAQFQAAHEAELDELRGEFGLLQEQVGRRGRVASGCTCACLGYLAGWGLVLLETSVTQGAASAPFYLYASIAPVVPYSYPAFHLRPAHCRSLPSHFLTTLYLIFPVPTHTGVRRSESTTPRC